MRNPILLSLLLCSTALSAQTAGDPAFFVKGSTPSDVKTYVTRTNSSLYALNSSGVPGLLPQSTFVKSTDLNTLGDARWRLLSTPLTISEVTGLQAALDAKAALSHTHAPADLTGFGAAGGYLRSNGSAWVRVGSVPWTDLSLVPAAVTALSGTNTGDQTLNSLLPTQTGHNGEALTTDGSNSAWTSVPSFSLSQDDIDAIQQANGTPSAIYPFATVADISETWGYEIDQRNQAIADAIDAINVNDLLPDQTGHSGEFLTTDGGNTSWAAASGGGGTWGSIAGTLSDQTDLQSALDGKSDVGHTHAATEISTTGPLTVADAGTTAVNGAYLEDGTENGRPVYFLVGGDQVTQRITWNGANKWSIVNGGNAEYDGVADVATPDLVPVWEEHNGASPPPTVGYSISNVQADLDAKLNAADLNTLGDARWALISHTHVSADITDASTGGNFASDAGLLAKYGSGGQLYATAHNSAQAAITGESDGSSYGSSVSSNSGTGSFVQSNTGVGLDVSSGNNYAVYASTTSATIPALEVKNFNTGGPIAHFHSNSTQALTIGPDGGLTWGTTGAATTRTGLGLGTAALISSTAGGDLSGTLPSPTVTKINGTSLAGLATGILKNTTTTGVPSIAVAGDFPTLNQNTTGSAATLTTSRTIGTATGDVTSAGSAFNGSSNNTNAYTLATVNSNVGSFGSATRTTTFTVNGKGLLTAAAEVTVTPAVGSITGLGTGVSTWLATPSSANLATAVTDETGSGALVFGTSPTFTTPILGTPTSGALTNCTSIPVANATGQLPLANGTNFMPATQQVVANLSTDFTTTSATYTSVTGLSATLAANSTYMVDIVVIFQSPATNTGVGVSMTLTNSPTIRSFYRRAALTLTSGSDAIIGSDDAGAIGATVGDANTDYVVHMEGIVKTGGSSSVLQMRCARGGTSGTITIQDGSSIVATKTN